MKIFFLRNKNFQINHYNVKLGRANSCCLLRTMITISHQWVVIICYFAWTLRIFLCIAVQLFIPKKIIYFIFLLWKFSLALLLDFVSFTHIHETTQATDKKRENFSQLNELTLMTLSFFFVLDVFFSLLVFCWFFVCFLCLSLSALCSPRSIFLWWKAFFLLCSRSFQICSLLFPLVLFFVPANSDGRQQNWNKLLKILGKLDSLSNLNPSTIRKFALWILAKSRFLSNWVWRNPVNFFPTILAFSCVCVLFGL